MDRKLRNRLIIVGTVAVLVALFFAFDLGRYLSLDYLKRSQARFNDLYTSHGVLVIGIYVLIYVAVTALSLPGAAVMTLAGGALFGLWRGTVAVSFASTIGATLACFVARFLLRDWVQGRFGSKLKAVDEGIRKEGAFYLFTLRLIPVFPFFVINLVMGLTRMPLRTFYWVSQVGMLPGTIVYVNAGKELAKIDSLGGILSPSLLLSFSLLGIFPIAVKKIMGTIRRARGIEIEVVEQKTKQDGD